MCERRWQPRCGSACCSLPKEQEGGHFGARSSLRAALRRQRRRFDRSIPSRLATECRDAPGLNTAVATSSCRPRRAFCFLFSSRRRAWREPPWNGRESLASASSAGSRAPSAMVEPVEKPWRSARRCRSLLAAFTPTRNAQAPGFRISSPCITLRSQRSVVAAIASSMTWSRRVTVRAPAAARPRTAVISPGMSLILAAEHNGGSSSWRRCVHENPMSRAAASVHVVASGRGLVARSARRAQGGNRCGAASESAPCVESRGTPQKLTASGTAAAGGTRGTTATRRRAPGRTRGPSRRRSPSRRGTSRT